MDFQKEQQLRSRLAGNIRRLRMSRSPCLSQKMLAKKLGVNGCAFHGTASPKYEKEKRYKCGKKF